MSKHPLVSIITPSYNQAKYLENTIQSIIAQGYPNIEYILIDGVSNDGSIEIIKKYSEYISWWISEKDNGQAEAINKGFIKAHGDIIAWVNSDDLLLPNAINQAVDFLAQNPDIQMVYSNAITIDSEGRPLNKLQFGEWGLREFMRFQIICQPAVFMRRSILDHIGYLDPTYHYMLDHHLWLRIASNHQVKHVDQFWAAARHHPQAKNVSHPEGFSDETLRLLEWMKNQSNLEETYKRDHRRIQGGAYRLIARYYLDSRMASKAIKYYYKASLNWRSYTMGHIHRILYAFLILFGIEAPAYRYYSQKAKRSSKVLIQEIKRRFKNSENNDQKITAWPGLRLE
jgi:glycosyltransferase involved in cell wall biosynthesis